MLSTYRDPREAEHISEADALLEQLRPQNPALTLTRDVKGTAIGSWSDEQSRFIPVIMRHLAGGWCMMPHEILINGELPYSPEDWVPIGGAA